MVRRARGRLVALVTALALATPAGAVAEAFGHGGCDVCPSSCPMHRTGTPRCHESREAKPPRAEPSSPGCKLAQRGCGQHGGERAVGLPPAVLTPHALALGLAPTAGTPPPVELPHLRSADPPETPPPVASA